MSRRLAAMEKRLGVRLFDRTASGYALTPARDEILDTVQHVEEEIASIDRRVAGKDLALKGDLRITCTEVFANLYLARHLPRFLQMHPEIDLSIVCTFEHLSLSRRESDVAIRVTSKPPETLIGCRLAKVAMGVYGSASSPTSDRKTDVASRDWIGWQDETYNRNLVYSQYPNARIRHRIDDILAMRSMARAGIGVAILPCYVGDQDPELRRIVSRPIVEGMMDLWLLFHPAIQRAARVRALSEFIAETVLADCELFEGRQPGATPA